MIAPAKCDRREGTRSCSAWYVAGLGGFRERGEAWIFAQLQAWIDHEGFPPPIILYDCGPGRRPARVDRLGRRSRWSVAAVDAWFAGQPSARIPAHIAESATAALAAHYASALDRGAEAIGGGARA